MIRPDIPLTWFLEFAAACFAIGLFGVVVRRNAIAVLMAIEIMLNAANVNLVAFWRYGTPPASEGPLTGVMVAIFVITIVMGDFITVGTMGGEQVASAGKVIETRLNALQFPPAAANAVILLVVTLAIIAALTRVVDVRKEL